MTDLRTSDLTPEQLDIFKASFLKSLGLEMPPTLSKPADKTRSAQPHVPDYLWDVYKRLSKEGNQQPSNIPPQIPIPGEKTAVVRPFYPAIENGIRILPDSTGGSVQLTFNLTYGFTPDETVREAFVRLHLNRTALKNLKSFRLNFYEITNFDKDISHLLDTKSFIPYHPTANTSSAGKTDSFVELDWIAFDAFPAVSRRVSSCAEQREVYRFAVELISKSFHNSGISASDLFELPVGDSSSSTNSDILWDTLEEEDQPVLLLYGEDLSTGSGKSEETSGSDQDDVDEAEGRHQSSDEHKQTRVKRRSNSKRPRNSRKNGRRRRGRRRQLGGNSAFNTYRRYHAARLCHRARIYVDFAELGWTNWIIAPPGYEAYFCVGRCEFPLHRHLNASNHAVVQALVHSFRPDLAPAPCCVPTEMSHISILYNDIYDHTVVKNYPQMIVEGCGCR